MWSWGDTPITLSPPAPDRSGPNGKPSGHSLQTSAGVGAAQTQGLFSLGV